MASLKDIKRRIKSVKNTRKITYAMKLVSAAKLKKAQDSVTAARAYTEALNRLLLKLAAEASGASFSHPLMEVRPQVRKIRLLIIGGSRGLCGGFNTNVNKKTDRTIRDLQQRHAGVELSYVVVGKKPAEHCRRHQIQYLKSYQDLPEDANLWPVDEICRGLEKEFIDGEIDEAFMIYTRFSSAMSQTVELVKLLPLDADTGTHTEVEDAAKAGGSTGNTLFEPSARSVFSAVIPRILRTKVRQAGLDSKASEHGSRMVAMDSATTNAAELIEKLTLTHNKLRQGAITAELLDIIGGANALED